MLDNLVRTDAGATARSRGSLWQRKDMAKTCSVRQDGGSLSSLALAGAMPEIERY